MYQFYKGFIIREGTEGISGEKLRELYLSVGWIGSSMPKWFNEKFEIAMKNSAWAFSVWYKEELIGLVRVISDKVMIANIQDLMIKPAYQKKGIGAKLVQLCLNKLPHGMWFAHTTQDNFKFYERFGFIKSNEERETTLTYNGYFKARVNGDR